MSWVSASKLLLKDIVLLTVILILGCGIGKLSEVSAMHNRWWESLSVIFGFAFFIWAIELFICAWWKKEFEVATFKEMKGMMYFMAFFLFLYFVFYYLNVHKPVFLAKAIEMEVLN